MTDTEGPSDDEADEAPADRGGVAVEDEDADPNARAFLHDPDVHPDDLGTPGPPLNGRAPFMWGLFGGLGALVAIWIGLMVVRISGVLLLVVVALFLAVGLNPAVEFLMRRGLKRSWAVLFVILGVVLVFAGFLIDPGPDHHPPGRRDRRQPPALVRQAPAERAGQGASTTSTTSRARSRTTCSPAPGPISAFGGAVGVGLAILGALVNAFVIVVLTLYFLASLPSLKKATYNLAPASRRERVSLLGDRILRSVGGYVSGAFVVATCAGLAPWSSCSSSASVATPSRWRWWSPCST